MSDLHQLLERSAAEYTPPRDLLDRVRARRRRRERNRRVATTVAAVIVTAAVLGGVTNALRRPDAVLVPPPADVFRGTWIGLDSDGSTQTMDIRVVEDRYEIITRDDVATVCSGASSTMTGTAHRSGRTLVIPTPEYTCDDGSEPVDSNLADALRDYTLIYDAETGTLSDSLTVLFERQTQDGEGVPETTASEPVASGDMWPQSNLDEVREAQERADAGDIEYTWQVDAALAEGNAGGDAQIFTRYLRQAVGWESFRWGDALPGQLWTADCDQPEGCISTSIAFVRCGVSETNPLYPEDRVHGDVPTDMDGTTCAPTLDDGTYETLTVVAEQPLRKGPNGLWVVTNSYPSARLRQTAPPAEADIAAVVNAFGQARVDGEGVEEHVTDADFPLLYAASNGSRYERFEYDLRGPYWPTGSFDVIVRLFADGGDTVVEQEFSLDAGSPSRLQLTYHPTASTENGVPVGEPYSLWDGRMTVAADGSWDEFFFGTGERTYGFYKPEEIGLETLFVVLDGPVAPAGPCAPGDRGATTDELVDVIRSNENLTVTAPVAVEVGGFDAVQLDITAAEGARTCGMDGWTSDEEDVFVLAPSYTREDRKNGWDRDPTFGFGVDDRMRLYLFDVPGDPASTFAAMVIAPEAGFDAAVESAAHIVESIQVHPD